MSSGPGSTLERRPVQASSTILFTRDCRHVHGGGVGDGQQRRRRIPPLRRCSLRLHNLGYFTSVSETLPARTTTVTFTATATGSGNAVAELRVESPATADRVLVIRSRARLRTLAFGPVGVVDRVVSLVTSDGSATADGTFHYSLDRGSLSSAIGPRQSEPGFTPGLLFQRAFCAGVSRRTWRLDFGQDAARGVVARTSRQDVARDFSPAHRCRSKDLRYSCSRRSEDLRYVPHTRVIAFSSRLSALSRVAATES